MATDYSRYQYIKIEKDHGLITLTLNRPDSLNAIVPPMHHELETIWVDVSEDPEVTAVLLTGAGRAFCAGADVKGFGKPGPDGSSHRKGPFPMNATEARRIIHNMLDVEQPIVAAINGAAVGLGCSLALLADITVADETARMADTHVKVGLVAGDGGAIMWPLLVGPSRAKEYLMTGNFITGAEAAKIGLVNYALPKEQVMPKAVELARQLADGPTWAIRWTKLAVNKMIKNVASLNDDAALAYETLTMYTQDHKEASAAFAEKRQPKFTGK
jgi:enoyl-CoA hydratase